MIGLVDCDCFYVSCERLFDPSLRETGIPVGIGISTTKTLAKLANRLAKNPPKA